MKILVINGPNINMLGVREPEFYGYETYDDLMAMIREKAREISERKYDEGKTDIWNKVFVSFFQSNHEGELVDTIQRAKGEYDGIIINPAAYTHTSIAILDALQTVDIPAIEVHISDLSTREEFRQISYIREACEACIMGEGLEGYGYALDMLCNILEERKEENS